MRFPDRFRTLWRRPAGPAMDRSGKLFALLTLAGFLVAFLAGFLLWLPLTPLTDRVEQLAARQGVQLSIQQPGLRFPLGVGAARLTVDTGNPLLPSVTIAEPALRPLWGSLFGSNPGVRFAGRLLSGSVDGEASRDGQLELHWSGLALQDQPVSPLLSLRVSATGASGHFSGRVPLTGSNQAEAELNIQQLQLSGLTALGGKKDDLRAGSLALAAKARGPLLNFDKLTLSGGELEGSGSGTLALGPRPAASRVNLSLNLKPGQDFDPALRDLLTLFVKPAQDGSLRLRLSGSLANPQLR